MNWATSTSVPNGQRLLQARQRRYPRSPRSSTNLDYPDGTTPSAPASSSPAQPWRHAAPRSHDGPSLRTRRDNVVTDAPPDRRRPCASARLCRATPACSATSDADRQLAGALFDRGIPLFAVENALLVGAARRVLNNASPVRCRHSLCTLHVSSTRCSPGRSATRPRELRARHGRSER
jgi:hypothetical protein